MDSSMCESEDVLRPKEGSSEIDDLAMDEPGASSSGDAGRNDAIDDTHMPADLMGKHWVKERILGKGGYFQVYKARTDDGRSFAMRVRLEPAGLNKWRKKRQGKWTKKTEDYFNKIREITGHIVPHPNLVEVIGFRKVGIRWQMITEYIDGVDLFDYIGRSMLLSCM
ncbi:unnamed protein product [Gongylonema pulchrum]|uniref:Protein kinase domain-containing protein n=1 Tax=Gongylonema pulchrum TaxID=637853 RepID=A0A183D5K8_9BILA|nr:unnamed protein product [Gongylonema pulchrum]